MSPASTLLTLAAVHLIAMASPGPNVLLVAQTAMSRSRAAALAVAAGVASGTAVLGTIAALGLGVVLQHVTWLHDGIRIAGGCYLAFLGLQTRRHAPTQRRRSSSAASWRRSSAPASPPGSTSPRSR